MVVYARKMSLDTRQHGHYSDYSVDFGKKMFQMKMYLNMTLGVLSNVTLAHF